MQTTDLNSAEIQKGWVDDRLAHDVIGAAIEVHRALGPGFSESVYEEAMVIELTSRGIPFVRQRIVRVEYRGQAVGEGRIDLLVDEELIVELKSVEAIARIHPAQVLSYLKASNLRRGLLINFSTAVLKDGIRRIVS